MKMNVALAGVNFLGIDTAPFIYLVEQHPTYLDRILAIFQQVAEGGIQAITSVVTLTEVLPIPIEKQFRGYLYQYREMLLNTSNITTYSITAPIAEQAAHLRARYKMRTPDALQISAAMEAGCEAFLTNDLAMKRVTELRILVLDEIEID